METVRPIIFEPGFLFFAAILFALGVYFANHGYRMILFFLELNRRGQSAWGRVIGLRDEVSGSSPQVCYTYPLFAYKINGQWLEVEGGLLLFEHFRIGQEMAVRFLPENPKKFTYRKTCLTEIGSLLLGLSFMALATWLFVNIMERL